MEVRWSAGDIKKTQLFAKELVALAPDIIFTAATPATTAVHHETQAIPTVFVLVVDPVERGFAKSVARPGGNMTGVLPFEPSLGGKWLDLLTKIAPGVKRFDFMFNPNTAPYAKSYFLSGLNQAAQTLNVQSASALVQSEAEIESAITSLGVEPRGGLVVIPDSFMLVNRSRIIALARQNKVPAVYFEPEFAAQGGLVAYGPDFKILFGLAAGYVDRILRGAKPSDLPIELPTKFQFVINLKTAKALGITVPQTLLVAADGVIE
jgi:putative ABC transport system substrate-binding protein